MDWDGEDRRERTGWRINKVKQGYAWDGASGPTFDTKSSMRPSLVHDAFCQMMRSRLIDYDKWQDKVNDFFKQQCKEDGMWGIRASIWYARRADAPACARVGVRNVAQQPWIKELR